MKRLLKWLGILAVGLVALLAVAYGVVYFLSERRIDKTYDVAVQPLTLPADEASLAEGRRLLTIRGCNDCHAADFGGKTFIDDPMLGTIAAANLTTGQGSATQGFSTEDWVRAIRHGIGPDGRSLKIMPSYEFVGLSDEQLGQMIAYLVSAPPADRVPAPAVLKPLGRILTLANQLPLLSAELTDHSLVAPQSVAPEASAAYGTYMISSCRGCHGENLAGGPVPGSGPDDVPAANLTPSGALSGWTLDSFKHTLRTGITPDGRQLDPADMPWTMTREMTDTEIEAIWLYLNDLPPATPAG